MTWLFTQVWLWSLAAFLLGSVFTWLLFVVPLKRRLNAMIAEYAHRPPAHTAQDADPRPTELDLFERTSGVGEDAADEPRPEFPGPGRWEPLDWQDDAESVMARTRSGLASLPVRHAAGESTDRSVVVSAPETLAPTEGLAPTEAEPDGRDTWFKGQDLGAEEPPEVPFDAAVDLSTVDEPPDSGPTLAKTELYRQLPGLHGELRELHGELPGLQRLDREARAPGSEGNLAPSDAEVTLTIPAVREDAPERPEQPHSAEPGAGYVIKGHFASRQYHTPDSPQYDRIVAEVWFRTVEDAQQAGFEPWDSRPVS